MADKEKQQERGRGSNVFMGTDPVREPGRLHRTSWQLGTVPGANILGKKFSLSHK